MAVEAQGRHMSLFSPQLIGNKIVMDGNANVYGSPVGYGGVPLISGTTTESFVPVYGSGMTESGLTCNFPVCRKRRRDEMNHHPLQSVNTFVGQDIWLQIQQQQQLEMDHFIAQHTEKMRLELQQRRKRNWKRIIMSAVEEGIVKRLKAKEQEIEKIGKLNCMLEDKVKSVCVENQIRRDLAESNEATANALRSNLEQVLLCNHRVQYFHPNDDCLIAAAAAAAAESSWCCGSNYQDGNRLDDGGVSNRLCRNCGQEESCVLVLPCRHLCLCSLCGSSLHTCPICKSAKNATLHVNLCS